MMKNNLEYTANQAIALTESMIDQDTKFNREVEALIKTDDAKEILINAYNQTDDAGKEAIAIATEEQFLDKFAPAGKEEESDGSEDTDFDEGESFEVDGSIFDENNDNDSATDDGSEDDDDAAGSENDDEGIFDDGSDNNNDNASGNEPSPFGSGDDGSLTAGGDEGGNPFFESRKPKHEHHLNEARKNARMSKKNKLNEVKGCEDIDCDNAAAEFDDDYYGVIYKFIKNKVKKFPSTRDKYLYLTKIAKNGQSTKDLAQKMVVKLGVDVTKYGKNWLNAVSTVISRSAEDIIDVEF